MKARFEISHLARDAQKDMKPAGAVAKNTKHGNHGLMKSTNGARNMKQNHLFATTPSIIDKKGAKMENVKTDTEDEGFWIGDKQHGMQFTNEGIYVWENGKKVLHLCG